MRTLISNIKQIVQIEHDHEDKKLVRGKEMDHLPVLDHAWLTFENGKITAMGTMDTIPREEHFDREINAVGKTLLPAWVDAHTHLVFAASREEEFVMRIHGATYAEIAEKGGGILNSARKTQQMDESELFDRSWQRMEEIMNLGTGAIEMKSGYGLTTESELKMLRVIRRIKEKAPIPVKISFLAAHAYPLEYRENHQGYLDKIIHEMLPQVADEGLADYMDVFCEKGFFSVEETDQLLQAAARYGLKPKIHGNQLYNSGGVQIAVKHQALSVDHLETLGDEEVECLRNSNTLPVLLPGASFFLAMHYPPARKLLDAGLPVVVASDFNPGSTPCGNMNFILSLACTQMKMTPNEAIHSMTLNAAAALELSGRVGTIRKGKNARFILTKEIPNTDYLPYMYGHHLVDQVIC